MSETMVMTVTCGPGTLTAERAIKIQEAALALLNQIAADLGGGVSFKAESLHWIDDGSDEITIRVAA